MRERRRNERYDIPLAVAVECRVKGRRVREETDLFNISLGGALFPLKASVELGNKLFVHFPEFNSSLGFGGGNGQLLKVKVQGRVVRLEESLNMVNRKRVAVAFDGPLRIMANRDIPSDRKEGFSKSTDVKEKNNGKEFSAGGT